MKQDAAFKIVAIKAYRKVMLRRYFWANKEYGKHTFFTCCMHNRYLYHEFWTNEILYKYGAPYQLLP